MNYSRLTSTDIEQHERDIVVIHSHWKGNLFVIEDYDADAMRARFIRTFGEQKKE